MQPSLQQWLDRKARGPAAKKRLPKVSKRKKRVNPLYTAAKRMHLAEFPFCQIGPIIRAAGFKVRCTGRARFIHHVKGRIGALLCDRQWFLSSCGGDCHPQWVHQSHVKEARELGLLQ